MLPGYSIGNGALRKALPDMEAIIMVCSEVITLFRSHLGQTMMMASMSGNAFRRAPFPMLYPGSIQVPDPYCHRCFYNQVPGKCGLLCVDRIDDFIEFASNGQ